jgi:hypothetical protein
VELLLLIATARAADCRPIDEIGASARQALLVADLDGAREQLAQVEHALGCGAVADPATLARLWLVEGVFAALDGREEEALVPLHAARVLDPGVWDDVWGESLRALWDRAAPGAEGSGVVDLVPPVAAPWAVFVDGRASSLPATLPAGLHAVQIGAEDVVHHGVVVLVAAGEQTHVSHLLPNVPPRPAPPPAPAPALSGSPFAGLALEGAVGDPVSAPTLDPTEPGAKLVLPVELGAVLRAGPAWLRGTAAVGPLLGGAWVYRKGQAVDAEPGRSPVAVGATLALGATVGRVDLGASFGAQWPSRLPARLVASLPLGALPLRLEGRGGLNVVTDRPAEPAFGLSFAYAR